MKKENSSVCRLLLGQKVVKVKMRLLLSKVIKVKYCMRTLI